jgi:hypothetical protein
MKKSLLLVFFLSFFLLFFSSSIIAQRSDPIPVIQDRAKLENTKSKVIKVYLPEGWKEKEGGIESIRELENNPFAKYNIDPVFVGENKLKKAHYSIYLTDNELVAKRVYQYFKMLKTYPFAETEIITNKYNNKNGLLVEFNGVQQVFYMKGKKVLMANIFSKSEINSKKIFKNIKF